MLLYLTGINRLERAPGRHVTQAEGYTEPPADPLAIFSNTSPDPDLILIMQLAFTLESIVVHCKPSAKTNSLKYIAGPHLAHALMGVTGRNQWRLQRC